MNVHVLLQLSQWFDEVLRQRVITSALDPFMYVVEVGLHLAGDVHDQFPVGPQHVNFL